MKKFYRTFAFTAVVAAAFTACNKETEVVTPAEDLEQVFTFAIGNNTAETRSILGSDENGKFVQFDSDDTGSGKGIGSIAPNAQGYSSITPATGDTPATFSIYTKGVALNDKITVWYPYRSTQTDATSVELVIPTEQNHKVGNAFDMKAMPMVTKQITVTQDMVDATTGNNTPIATINFANMGSLLNFKVFSTNSSYEGEQVMSITFTANSNIGGTFTKNLSTIDPDNEETMTIGNFTSGSTSIVTKPYNDAASIGTAKANALDLFMVVAPGTYTGTVMVKTDAAEYTYTISSAKTFVRSGIKAFGLDLGNCTNRVAQQTVIPITVNKTINEILTEMGKASVDNGTEVNPLSVDNNVTLSTTGTGNNGKVYGNGTEWRLYQAGSGNAVVSVASGYELQSVKFVYTSSSVSGTSVSFDVTNTGSATNGQARLTAITVKYVSTGSSVKQDPILAFNNPTTTVTVGETVTNVATIDPNTLSVTYSSSDDTIASVDPDSGEVTGIAAGTATITASFAGNDAYYSASDSYVITVSSALPSGVPGDETFDLSKKTYTIGDNLVTWTGESVVITNSGTNATNYLGGDANNRTSSRFYSDNSLVITPNADYTIASIVFTATSENYANTLGSSTWNNGSASVDGTTVTVTPLNGANAVSATVGGTCGFTSIVINYVFTGVVVTKYDITIDSDIVNGSVSASMSKAAEGATVNLTATPASGYEFGTWDVYKTGESSTKVSVTNNSFTMPAYAVTVAASFVAVPTISMNTTSIVDVAAAGVSATATSAYNLENGALNTDVTITCDGTVVTAASKNATAGSIDYTVAANSGNARSGWIKVKYGSEEPHEITVSQQAGVDTPITGTVLFSCDFGSSAIALASYTGGTSYNSASTITYTASDASKVKIDTNSATNMTGGNLYFNGKNNSVGYTATIAGIKTYGATKVTVVWAANNASSDLEITGSSTSKVTSANSATNRAVFDLTGTETTISLVFSNNAKANTRVDNVTVYFGEVTD